MFTVMPQYSQGYVLENPCEWQVNVKSNEENGVWFPLPRDRTEA